MRVRTLRLRMAASSLGARTAGDPMCSTIDAVPRVPEPVGA
jgi:hypothetical protein